MHDSATPGPRRSACLYRSATRTRTDDMMADLDLSAEKSALILIDLMNVHVELTTAPHASIDVLARARQLAEAFRARSCLIAYARTDLAGMDRPLADKPYPAELASMPPFASEVAASAGFKPGDLLITKRGWDAFTNTDLELCLRSRGIQTLIVAGISTDSGVESTVRRGADLGFACIVAEDACASPLNPERHNFPVRNTFPRIARMRSSAELLAAIA